LVKKGTIKIMTVENFINQTVESIVKLLMPTIYFVSDSDALFKKLKKDVSWLIRCNSINEIINIDDTPIIILHGDASFITKQLTMTNQNQAIIICQTGPHSNSSVNKISSLSVRLTSPSVEEILFHIKALSIINEAIIYSDGESHIISLNQEVRSNIGDLIDHIHAGESIIVKLNRNESPKTWYKFLFQSLPKRIRPIIYKPDVDTELSNDMLNVIFNHNDIDLSAINTQVKFICLTHEAPNNLNGIRMIDFTERKNDEKDFILRSYLNSVYSSHHLPSMAYFANIDPNLKINQSSLMGAVESSGNNISYEKPDYLLEFINNTNAVSLPTLLSDIEFRVLTRLKEKTARVKGTSFASNISTSTLHKKIERYQS